MLYYYIFLLVSIFISIPVRGQDSIGCYVDGECLQSNFIGVTEVDGLEECRQFCLDREGCIYFTYYRDSKVKLYF